MIETPRTDKCQTACLRSGGAHSGQIKSELNIYQVARDMEREITRLRAIFPKILEALESGGCSPDCSVEFMELIPNEVMLVVRKLKAAASRQNV